MSVLSGDKDTTGVKDSFEAGPNLRPVYREYVAIIFTAVSVFLLLCLLSYDPKDPSFNVATTRSYVSNLCGLIGAHIADVLFQLLGLCAILIPLVLIVLAFKTFMLRRTSIGFFQCVSVAVLICGIAALFERFSLTWFQHFSGKNVGGAIGSVIHEFLSRFLGSGGELVLIITLSMLCLLYLSDTSLIRLAQLSRPVSRFALRLIPGIADRLSVISIPRFMANALKNTFFRLAVFEKSKDSAKDIPPTKSREGPFCYDHFDKNLMGVHSWERISFLPQEVPQELERADGLSMEQSIEAPALDVPLREAGETAFRRSPWRTIEISNNPTKGRAQGSTKLKQPTIQDEDCHAEQTQAHAGGAYPQIVDASRGCDKRVVPTIRVSRRADENTSTSPVRDAGCSTRDDYQYPPIELLDTPEVSGRSIDESVLAANARILEQKLSDLGIQGNVVEIHPGPVITMYELSLASGIPLRKVLNTSDDLAMALKSGSTRVVAPIHGKDTVGIEVPNQHREIVYFREIVESDAFVQSTAPLKIALGKGIDGEPFSTSLTRMPHLMIAGATGTGKSVGLNCLICSWLMCYHPDDVKFLMVDPKKLELSYYQDIPHLIHPVVTEPEKVPKVLSWAIKEMERRYDLLSKTGAKNIESYNQQILEGSLAVDPDVPPPEKLPYLIIIVDELAELMMVAAKDIEISIARLAQMARASGIHLILATQRPSVDVITGVIKANFPARISYQVSAKPDSRTILDATGAEHLLGMGDMLFLPPGTAKLVRLHGAFVSENEIRKIADFAKAQRSPVYLNEIAKHMSDEDSKVGAADLLEDEKYDEAVELVTRLGHASISLIQRHMRIGYNRAARIIEVMEAEGIIGPSDGTSRPREVLARSLETIPDHRGASFA